MSLRADIIRTPGLANADDEYPSLGQPYDGAIDDFLVTPGVRGTDIVAEVTDTLTDETAEALPGWEALRRLFAREHHRCGDIVQQPIELEGYWMMLPDVSGASVELNVSHQKTEDISASLTIAGIGGGPQFTINLKEGLTHKATSSEKVIVTTMAKFQTIEVTRRGKVIGTYPRLVDIDMGRRDWSFRPEAPPSPAALGDQVPPETSFDTSGTDGSTTVSLSMTRGTTWSISVGLTLPPNLGGISANVSTKLTYETATEFRYMLPPRHRYVATMYKAIPAYIWTVLP